MKSVLLKITEAQNGLVIESGKIDVNNFISNKMWIISDESVCQALKEIIQESEVNEKVNESFEVPRKKYKRRQTKQSLEESEKEMLSSVIPPKEHASLVPARKVYLEMDNWAEPKIFNSIKEVAELLNIAESTVYYFLSKTVSKAVLDRRGITEIRYEE